MIRDSGVLTSLSVKSATPGKHYDGRGLLLLVLPNGRRYWRLKYRFGGREKSLALGVYPEVSLAEARKRRDEARAELQAGNDPAQGKRERRMAAKSAGENTFATIAEAWLTRQQVAEITSRKNRWILDHLMPALGSRPINEIAPRELLAVLRKIEEVGKLETARRAKIKAGQVFRFAILEGRTEFDPTSSLRGALKSPDVKHHAAITDPKAIGELLRAIDGFAGQPVTAYALKFAPLVFVRPRELRCAEWCEFDLDARMWRIPATRMKMKAAHLVPLSTQAVGILRELGGLTGTGRFLFPSVRTPKRPMSENTINAALRRLGYTKDQMTGHGFRSMAATRLNEMGYRADAIERQLAHAESDKVRDAYTNAAQYLDERSRMMQDWADCLDQLRQGATVIPIHSAMRWRERQ